MELSTKVKMVVIVDTGLSGLVFRPSPALHC